MQDSILPTYYYLLLKKGRYPFFRKNTSKCARIFQVCWFVCRKNLLTRDKPVFGDDSVFKLFRIFCLLADLVQDADDINHYVVSD